VTVRYFDEPNAIIALSRIDLKAKKWEGKNISGKLPATNPPHDRLPVFCPTIFLPSTPTAYDE
jgi:hypothetical protein